MFGDVFKLQLIISIIVVMTSEDVSTKKVKKPDGPSKKAMPSIPPKFKIPSKPPVFEKAANPSIPPKTDVSTQSAKKPKAPDPPKKAVPSIPPKTATPSTPPLLEAAAIPSIPPKTEIPSTPPIFEEAPIPSIPPKTEIPSASPIFEDAPIPSIPPKTEIPSAPPIFEDAPIPSIPPKTEIASTPPLFEAAAIPSIPPKTEIVSTPLVLEGAAIPSIPPETKIPSAPPGFDSAAIIISMSPVVTAVPNTPPQTNVPEMAEKAASNPPETPPEVTTKMFPSINDLSSNSSNHLGMGTTVNTSGDDMTPFLESLLDSAPGDTAQFDSAQPSDSGSSSNTVVGSGSVNSQITLTSVNYPSYEDVKALYQFLLESYDTRVRPKLNQSHTTQVSAFFSLLNILDFNIATQTFDILGYFYFVWEDEFLTWKPRKFSRIRWIKVPKPEIWTPQFSIANMYSGESKIGDPTDRVLVTYKGKVSWVPEATYKIVCEVEIEFYPFDRQTCKLTFHVSDDTISEVELFTDQKHNGIRTDHYIENSEWKLVNASVEKYNINDVSYMDVIFIVERRLEFIFFTIVAPLLLLSVLNLCAFLIPVESEEKGDYSVTIVITYGVFISHITTSLPPNSMTIPYFLLYMIWLLGFSVSTVIYSIIQSRLYSHYGKRRISLKLITMCFGRKIKPGDENVDDMDDKTTIKVVRNIEHVTDKARRSLLCGDMLKKLDVIMIILYILSITATTLYFFFSMNVSNIF